MILRGGSSGSKSTLFLRERSRRANPASRIEITTGSSMVEQCYCTKCYSMVTWFDSRPVDDTW